MKKDLFLVMLLYAISVLVVAISLDSVYAQENTTDSEIPKFFAIQHAQSGSIAEINVNFTLSANMELNNTILTGDKSKLYQLLLNNVSDKTILFSDRPDRIVEIESTSDYLDNWTTGENSFANDAPNAVLVVDESEKQADTIVELFNPVYDSNKKVLKYEVISDNVTSIDLPSEFRQATLLIDPGGQSGAGTGT